MLALFGLPSFQTIQISSLKAFDKFRTPLKRIFNILNSEDTWAAVSLNAGQDFITSVKDTLRVHGITFENDESVNDLFAMANRFDHLVFEECKFLSTFEIPAVKQ